MPPIGEYHTQHHPQPSYAQHHPRRPRSEDGRSADHSSDSASASEYETAWESTPDSEYRLKHDNQQVTSIKLCVVCININMLGHSLTFFFRFVRRSLATRKSGGNTPLVG
jgi:hypothetical protein